MHGTNVKIVMKLLIIRSDWLMRYHKSMLVCYRKDVRLPLQLQRAMAAEAEAAREARAKVIAAEGEMKASRALKEASDVIAESPAALQVCHGNPKPYKYWRVTISELWFL